MNMKIASSLPDDLEELIRNVIGAAIEVHRDLGPGFLESIYEKALCHELSTRGIVFEQQKEILFRTRISLFLANVWIFWWLVS